MKLNRELAEKVVKKTMNVLGKNINIMNSKGIIIGSGNKKRLNSFHEIASEVIKTKEVIIINEEKVEEYKGVKPGINLPILFNKEIIGVVGITGKAKEVSKYGKLVKNMVELILQQEFLRHEIEIDNRAKENFYQQLLNKDIKDQDLLDDRLNFFNIKKALNRIVFVISFETFNAKLITNTINNLNDLIFIKKDDIFIIRGDKLVLIKTFDYQIKEIDNKKIIELAKKLVLKFKKMVGESKLGIGTMVDDINDLHISYHDAMLALEVGNKLKNKENDNIFSINNLGYNYMLPFIEKYHVNNFLESLFHKQNYEEYFNETNLGEIIEALVKNNLNISQTADDLYIHRNTLLYQLNKIKDQTGYNLKNLSELFTLLLAYHLYLFDH
ncbi:MAG: CdaR family transcriptional regulator [Bacillota bacterium]